MAVLQSVRVTMLNNNIQMCVDSRFNKYEVPLFCLNEPLSFAQETIAEKNLNFQYSDAAVKVKIRSVAFPSEDVILNLNSKTGVAEVKNALRENKSLGDKGIRLFYGGREMSDNHTLGNYSYTEGSVIQAMIR